MLNYDDKPPGMTLAEWLGIQVPDDAPGGQRIRRLDPAPGGGNYGAELEQRIQYDGFPDIDGYGRADDA